MIYVGKRRLVDKFLIRALLHRVSVDLLRSDGWIPSDADILQRIIARSICNVLQSSDGFRI